MCEKTFTTEYNLDVHRCMCAFKRGLPNHYQCDTCKKGFPTQEYLTKHKCCSHNEPHSCGVCEKTFATRSSQLRHERGHYTKTSTIRNVKRVKQYQCDICEKKITTKHTLDRHRRLCAFNRGLVNQDKHKCDICKAEFSIREYLSQHKRLIHRGPGRYPCNACGKTFTSQTRQIHHQKTHETDTTTSMAVEITATECPKQVDQTFAKPDDQPKTGTPFTVYITSTECLDQNRMKFVCEVNFNNPSQ